MIRLKKRADFRAAAKAERCARKTLVLQCRRRSENETGPARIGFTVTKRTGGAVERNRMRRRLKAAVAEIADRRMRTGHDYVVIGRRAALSAPFETIRRDLDACLRRVHGAGRQPANA